MGSARLRARARASSRTIAACRSRASPSRARPPRLYGVCRRLLADATRPRPDALVAVDFPDFNLRLAHAIAAGRAGRLLHQSAALGLAARTDEDHAADCGPRAGDLPVRGGDLPARRCARRVRRASARRLVATPWSRRAVSRAPGARSDASIVAVLPGSRINEVRAILPELLGAARIIRGALPAAQFVLARAPHLPDELFAAADRRPVEHDDRECHRASLSSADVALTASGTATVQTALHDTPMVVVYRLSPTYRLGRPFVKLDTFAMVNLIAGERSRARAHSGRFHAGGGRRHALAILGDPRRADADARRVEDRQVEARDGRREPTRGRGRRGGRGRERAHVWGRLLPWVASFHLLHQYSSHRSPVRRCSCQPSSARSSADRRSSPMHASSTCAPDGRTDGDRSTVW